MEHVPEGEYVSSVDAPVHTGAGGESQRTPVHGSGGPWHAPFLQPCAQSESEWWYVQRPAEHVPVAEYERSVVESTQYAAGAWLQTTVEQGSVAEASLLPSTPPSAG
jgi:hypothetical protein